MFVAERSHRAGFTLLEIMIVVMVIAILLGLAIPNFMPAREKSREKACMENLRQLTSAKEQFVMENKKTTWDTVDWDDLVPAYVKSRPECPSGGEYALGVVGAPVTCSVAGHEY